ncbi:MAG: SCO family protein [Deltaproteobacteria bacterium]|nr:SCO family protein [Deltaproteobacteria bacterium]
MPAHSPRRALAGLALALAALPAGGAPPGSPWGAAYFPDVELTTHEGRRVRFYADLVRDRRVVVSFIYTRCTQICGLATANLARVQRELGERVGKDIHLYSVSLEPEHDTPERLRAFAAAFRARPGWTFLTGRAEDVALLRKKFGDLAPIEEHAPVIEIGNDVTGQWWRTSALDNPRYLATVIAGFMDPAWDGRSQVAARGYRAAPPVAAGKGQALFRQRCAACHVPGGDSVGPDLAGVTRRRDPAWLARWIRSPGTLIDGGDPLALELLERHGGIAMPPSDLSASELDAVLAYLRSQDRQAAER